MFSESKTFGSISSDYVGRFCLKLASLNSLLRLVHLFYSFPFAITVLPPLGVYAGT